MDCNTDPTYGQIPSGNGATDPAGVTRIEELQNFILQYENLDPGYGKDQLKSRYLAAKEELEFLLETPEPAPEALSPAYVPRFDLQRWIRENRTAATIAGAALGALILRRLFK